MVKCLYVCNEKAYFLYSRDFDDLYMIGAVCLSVTKVNISVSRGFVVSPVSRHIPYSKGSRNRKTTKSHEIITFQGIL